MRELFVYYRARPGDATAVLAAAQQLQAQLRDEYPALRARLLRRPDDDHDLHTWMETYATDDGITVEMQNRIEAQARVLAPLIEGARHTEVFIACAS